MWVYSTAGRIGTGLLETPSTTNYRDTSRLSAWVIGMLLACAFTSLLCLFARLLEIRFLLRVRDGIFLTQRMAETAGAESDFRIALSSGFMGLAMIVTVVLVAIWTYRVCYNAHQFGALAMRYSPAASVGWYFVPFANLWKPYDAMCEIWRVSENPEEWHSRPAANIVGVWWILWIIMLTADRAHSVVMRKAQTVDMFLLASKLGIMDDIALASVSIALAAVVRGIQELQQNTVASQIAQAIPLDEAS